MVLFLAAVSCGSQIVLSTMAYFKKIFRWKIFSDHILQNFLSAENFPEWKQALTPDNFTSQGESTGSQ
jgi:hypothetical protein